MNLNEDDDFGFSLVSEDELKEYENKLLKEVEQKDGQVQHYGDKLEGIRKLVMPLLNNLMANPDKHYIYWPNRTEKIQQFIKKLDSYIND